jgi:hypothetical protein
MHVRVCRVLYLELYSNLISGSFPSVVSGLSSLSYVQSVLCVFASAWPVCDVHTQCTVCICYCVCVRCMCGCCVSECVGAWCGSCVAVTSVQWVCEPWWVASAVVALVSVRGRISSMRGSAVSMLSCVVIGDACACVQALGPGQQPDQRQLSVGGVRAVVPSVRAMCVLRFCLCMGCVRCASAVCICDCVCVRCMCGVVRVSLLV